MAKRESKVSIGGLWKKMQRHVPRVFGDGDSEKSAASEKELANYLAKVNDSYIPESISQNFIALYFENDTPSTVFNFSEGFAWDGQKKRPVEFDSENSVMTIDIHAMYHYLMEFSNAQKKLREMKDNGVSDFKTTRQLSFMRELSKIPPPYLFYIAVLQEVAYQKEIVSVEDKEGVMHKSDSGFYLTLLWALKEFESFYLKTQNRFLRADYSVIWHEGEWVEDDTRGRGYV